MELMSDNSVVPHVRLGHMVLLLPVTFCGDKRTAEKDSPDQNHNFFTGQMHKVRGNRSSKLTGTSDVFAKDVLSCLNKLLVNFRGLKSDCVR